MERIHYTSFSLARVLHCTWLVRVARDEYSSLLDPIVRYEKMLCVVNTASGVQFSLQTLD
jgi:hypothetical protein